MGSDKRRTVKLVVAIQIGYGTVVVPVSSSRYDGFVKSNQYFTVERKPATGLTGAEYVDIVQNHLFGSSSRGTLPGVTTRSGRTILVHDRDPSHTADLFRGYAATHRLDVELMPPRSPDLSPLDSGFFGAVKTKWEREVKAQRLGWTQGVLRFIELLKQQDPAPFINHIPMCLEACKRANGWHIEEQLKALKRR